MAIKPIQKLILCNGTDYEELQIDIESVFHKYAATMKCVHIQYANIEESTSGNPTAFLLMENL